MRRTLLLSVGIILILSGECGAEVKFSGGDHFTVSMEHKIKAAPDVVWHHLLDIGSWWSSSHTWSGDAKNLVLNAKPGGGFDETLPAEGGFVRHMNVIYSDPEKMLRMVGVLGPLQEEALNGTMNITLTKRDQSTIIKTTYKVSGHFEGGLDMIAPVVDKVLQEQFSRLVFATEKAVRLPKE
jgi:hypothetical protein